MGRYALSLCGNREAQPHLSPDRGNGDEPSRHGNQKLSTACWHSTPTKSVLSTLYSGSDRIFAAKLRRVPILSASWRSWSKPVPHGSGLVEVDRIARSRAGRADLHVQPGKGGKEPRSGERGASASGLLMLAA
jgi:hypothetical protein